MKKCVSGLVTSILSIALIAPLAAHAGGMPLNVVTAPVAGSNLRVGQPVVITWTEMPAVSNVTYTLREYVTQQVIATLTSDQAHCGATCSFTWTPTQAAANDWIAVSDYTHSAYGNSGFFSVVSGGDQSLTPSISSVSPTTLTSGQQVTIYGSNFTPDTSVNFSWNGTIMASMNSNNIRFVSPNDISFTVSGVLGGNMDGPYNLSVMNAHGNSNMMGVNFPSSENASSAGNSPSITVRSAPSSLQTGETGTWQMGINYPTTTVGTSSFYAVWGDEQTPPAQFPYVGPNNTSGADDAVKFFHAYATPGTYQPRFIVVNSQGQTASLSTIVYVGDSSQPTVNMTVNGASDRVVRVPSGTDVSIAWSSKNATSCSVSDDHGYNSVGNSPSSSIVIHAPVNATYTVTCSNAVKDASKSITIVVVPTSTCTPSWSCQWGACMNGYQSESAVDANHCGTQSPIACPALAKACSSSTQNTVPPAGYEDEVLTNIQAYQNPFPDTDMSELSGKAAAELYRRAVLGGFPDGQFKGEREVNRAEAAKFLLLARYGTVAETSNSGKFTDVLDGQWYTKFVMTAAQYSIINGYGDGTFGPEKTVKTAEFLKMLALTFNLQKGLPYSYTDVSSDDWFAPYAGLAVKYDLFPGFVGTLDRSTKLSPNAALSRTEVAVAIYQYLSKR